MANTLEKVYESVDDLAKVVYVVPLIRYNNKKTDYLYLLYKDILESGKYRVESISIFSHFKLVSGILKNRHSILHYHWLEFQDFKSILGMPWKIMCIWLFKLLGGKIIWTLHNEFPHDQKYLKLHLFLHKRMSAWATKLHVHCQSAIPIMSEKLKADTSKFFIYPHPMFPADIEPKATAIEKLNAEFELYLNPDVPVILMFGNISRYKQMDKVAEMIIDLPEECKLLIVGPIKKGNFTLYKQLRQLERQSSRIIIIPKFINEEHVPWFHNAADVCVFNYREILSSGGVHLALSYHKDIIAPAMGCLHELKDRKNVQLFTGQDELKSMLAECLGNNR